MDKQRYQRLADACLDQVSDWLDRFDPDEVDFRSSDGVVRLDFSDGTSFVLNRQAGSHQVWYAAGARAWHYDWDEERSTWVDDRDGHVLFDNVRDTVAAKLGRAVDPIA